jgi:electron transport complex protein RnfC
MSPSGTLPCIRCGDCNDVCPQQLSPLRLHEHLSLGDERAARAYRLLDCSECGACAAVCPSRIALTESFRAAKLEHLRREQLLRDADAARTRFLARNARLDRLAAERAEAESHRSQAAASVDAVQAALARARARKRGPEAKSEPDA